MVNDTIHRLVEQQAALRGDAFAYLDGRRALTYRDLNARANATARALSAHGFKRGSFAAVRMPPSSELAVMLLAILKAGGGYRLVDAHDPTYPVGLSLVADGICHPLEIPSLLDAETIASPNLPILTRGSDIACVMPGTGDLQDVQVPHATIAALRQPSLAEEVHWSAESGALDLWVGLMAGATVMVTEAPAETVAA